MQVYELVKRRNNLYLKIHRARKKGLGISELKKELEQVNSRLKETWSRNVKITKKISRGVAGNDSVSLSLTEPVEEKKMEIDEKKVQKLEKLTRKYLKALSSPVDVVEDISQDILALYLCSDAEKRKKIMSNGYLFSICKNKLTDYYRENRKIIYIGEDLENFYVEEENKQEEKYDGLSEKIYSFFKSGELLTMIRNMRGERLGKWCVVDAICVLLGTNDRTEVIEELNLCWNFPL